MKFHKNTFQVRAYTVLEVTFSDLTTMRQASAVETQMINIPKLAGYTGYTAVPLKSTPHDAFDAATLLRD